MTRTRRTRLGTDTVNVLMERNATRTYYELHHLDGFEICSEIVWVREARVAYNLGVKRHGAQLLNITNLETGELVMGSTA